MADAIRLCALPENFDEHFLPYKPTLRQRIRGKKFSNESYIARVQLFKSCDDEIHIKAGVYRSQRRNEDVHQVNMAVATDSISDAFCTCTAGTSGQCAHVLAVVYKVTDWILGGLKEVPDQPACTSVPQQWDRPRGSKIVSEPVTAMVIAKSSNCSRRKRPLVADFSDNRKLQLLSSDIEHLKSLSGSPISYLVHHPDKMKDTAFGPQNSGSALSYQLPLIEPIQGPTGDSFPCGNLCLPIVSDTDLKSDENWSHVEISQADAVQLEVNTRQQSHCSLWKEERKKRITASNFGRFMIRKLPVTQKFVDSIKNQKDFCSSATSYGSASEKVAKIVYRKKTGNHVHECGFVVNPAFPFIGASPDGKVCDSTSHESGILEIKCPFSIRDMTIEEGVNELANRSQFHLERDGDQIVLKKKHSHFYQVQGQLLVTGAKFCDFVTYTRNDTHIQRIYPDRAVFLEIFDKLQTVCKNFKF